jgi:hypothetical protein
VTICPDSRFAFINVEGVGDDPGTVDVIALETFETRASIDIGKRVSGIIFWKTEPSGDRAVIRAAPSARAIRDSELPRLTDSPAHFDAIPADRDD